MRNLEKAKEFSLSCVESYTLYTLLQHEEPIELLFVDDYRSFSEIVKFLKNNDTSYAFYNGIKRIHERCAENNIIDFHFYMDNKCPRMFDQNIVTLIQGKSEVLTKEYKVTFLRDDHYLMIVRTNDNISIVNDYPLSILSSDMEFVNTIYAGKYILIDFKGKICEKVSSKFKFERDTKDSDDLSLNGFTGLQIRDALLIYKISLKRTFAYLNYVYKISDLEEYVKLVDQAILQIDYANVKGNEILKKQVFDNIIKLQSEIEKDVIDILGKKEK